MFLTTTKLIKRNI